MSRHVLEQLKMGWPEEGSVSAIPIQELSARYMDMVGRLPSPYDMDDDSAGKRKFEKLCAIQHAYEVLSDSRLSLMYEKETEQKRTLVGRGSVSSVSNVVHPCSASTLEEMARSNWISDSESMLTDIQKWRMNNFIDLVRRETRAEITSRPEYAKYARIHENISL